jgi:hypothetical protein
MVMTMAEVTMFGKGSIAAYLTNAGAEHTAAQVPTCVFRVHKKLICMFNVVKSVTSFRRC